MGWTILALILTVIMGGIIAYTGDLIGRRFGKKRISLFKLRPKNTAILITSFTGVFISGLTTGTLFMVLRPVREIILDGENAIRQLPGLNKKVRDEKQQIADYEVKSAALHQDLARMQEERDRKSSEL